MALPLILILSAVAPSPALAGDNEPRDPTTKSASKLSNADLERMAEAIYHERLSPGVVQQLYDSLNDTERAVITRKLAGLNNVPFDALQTEIASNTAARKNLMLAGAHIYVQAGVGGPRPQSPGPAYDVQMPALTNLSNVNPNVGMSSYWWDPSCDSDPGDGDFRFFANTPQSVYPSQMRWYSTSGGVTWAINTAYGGILSTYGFGVYEINICLGVWGTNLAGGPQNVQQALRVKYR